MDRRGRIAALVIFTLFVGNLLNPPTPDLTGRYEVELSGTWSTGSDEPDIDWKIDVAVNVDRQGQELLLEFDVTRVEPYSRTLDACVVAHQARSTLYFDFEDSWGNTGRGQFFQRGDKYVLNLECLGGDGQHLVGMLYSDWELEKKSR
jgi:hypothetical protein